MDKMDLNSKRVFLYQGSQLYDRMIGIAPSDTIRRYLAFRIIVNAMAFEDLIAYRQQQRMREIRDAFLAHKQEPEFFEGYRAVEDIRNDAIKPLLEFMASNLGAIHPKDMLPENINMEVASRFSKIAALILRKYQDEEIEGFRISNNFLSFEGNQI